MFTIYKPIWWQYFAHVVLIDSLCTWRASSGGKFFKATSTTGRSSQNFCSFLSKVIPSENYQARLLIKHNESGSQEGKQQLRLVFPLMLQVYATRGPTSYHKYNFVRLLTILFSTRLVPKKLSLHSKVFRKAKVFLNDFFHRIYLHVELQHFDMSRFDQLDRKSVV